MSRRFLPVIVLSALPYAALAEPLILNTENWFPYNYEKDGKILGTSTEIVEKAAKAAGVDYKIVLGPWNRSYNTALNQPNNCVYSTSLTDDRKPLFKWVKSVGAVRWYVFKLKGSSFTASSIDDLKGKTIGGYVGDASAEFLKKNGIKVDQAPSDDVNPKKLKAGRIDAWATAELPGIRLAKKAGVEIEPTFNLLEYMLTIACNKSVDDAVIAKLQKAVDDINASGEGDKIRARNS